MADLKTSAETDGAPALSTDIFRVARGAGNARLTLGDARSFVLGGNTLTAGTGTLTLGAGKTLTASNTLTLTGTDGSTLAIGAGGTLGSNAYTSTAHLPLAGGTLTGHLLFTDATYDIGAIGATRPRNIFLTGTVASQYIEFRTSSLWTYMDANGADGQLALYNAAGTSFGRVMLGGTSASFPAIKRNGTGIDIRLANDSAYAPLTAGDIVSGAAGKGLQLQSGTGARAGAATLVAGTVTVTNTTVTSSTIVLLTRKTAGGTLGMALTYTLSAGSGFTINSDNGLDTSTISYMLLELNA